MQSEGDPKKEMEACENALRRHKDDLLRKKNVVGVAIGKKVVGGEERDELCVTVFVKKKEPRAALDENDAIPGTVDDVKTDVIETGEIVAYSRTVKVRPCPPGMSIGHVEVTAGTFGCVVRDEHGRHLILSNNHVLSNSNDASPGDAILQPGRIDGGTLNDSIGSLHRFVPISFEGGPSPCPIARIITKSLNYVSRLLSRRSRFTTVLSEAGPNLVDAAVGLPNDPTDIKPDILDLGEPVDTEVATIGLDVRKSGRTTGTTSGRIANLNATVRISYGAGRTATFENQMVISDGQFSAPGDSGSAICTLIDGEPRLVGLLFAGSDTVTIANKIEDVFRLLEVTL